MPLSAAQLAEIVSGRLLQSRLAEALSADGAVAIDSRTVKPSEIFWALPGNRCDGRDFITDAFQRGAAGAVCERSAAAGPGGGSQYPGRWIVEVDSAREAINQLALWRRSQSRARVTAVTGSVGKTTARAMIQAVLGGEQHGMATVGNRNNSLGLPWSVTSLRPQHEYAVFELGASAPGEIARLSAICRPEIGVITQIGDAHLGSFGGVAELAAAKAELIESLPSAGHAVLNGDDPWQRRLATQLPKNVIWCGRDGDNHVVATQVQSSEGRLSFVVAGQKFSISVWGRHYLASALAAIAVGRVYGHPDARIAESLAQFEPIDQRCEVRNVLGATVINDTYNASPIAMRAALKLLGETQPASRRIAVCGDMRELGQAAAGLHRRMGSEVVTEGGADLLVAVGDFRNEVAAGAIEAGMAPRRVQTHVSAKEAAGSIRQIIQPGDVILIKGSRAVALEKLVAALDARASDGGAETTATK